MNDSERFDKFTDRAKNVLHLAQEEAENLSCNAIAPEHLLLGLIREGGSIAARVLQHLGLGLSEARSIVTSLTTPGEDVILNDYPLLTLDAQRVIEASIAEAQQLNHSYVGPEHILLGLMREGDTAVINILDRLGINQNEVQTLVIQIFGGSPLQEHNARSRNLPAIEHSELDPWLTAQQRYVTHQEVVGTIAKIVPFGAFVRIEDGIEGLLHLSELAPGMNLERDIHEGQQLRFSILNIDAARRRLGLTLR